MEVARILRGGLAEAKSSGAKQVELQHLGEQDAGELADRTLTFLRSRPGRPSSTSGWTAVAASRVGVIPWWAEKAGLTTESQRRWLRPLLREIYGLLDEQGLIVKPAGPRAAVDVSPVGHPAEEEPAEEGPAEGEPAEDEPAVLLAWVLRVEPSVWDLGRYVADGHREVSSWAVEDSDQAALMGPGQRVFVWAGGDGTLIVPGIWGVGWVVGPCRWRSVPDGYWVDPAVGSQVGLFADVSIHIFPVPVGRQQVIDEPGLAAIEVVRDPLGSNPTRLSLDEAAAMLALVGLDPLLPGH